MLAYIFQLPEVQDARSSPCQRPGVFRCRASQNIERPMPPVKTEGFEKDLFLATQPELGPGKVLRPEPIELGTADFGP